MIDLSDYYSGGYFLIRADKPDWPQLQTDLYPDKFISLSRCICPRVEVVWGWKPGDRDAALQFGVPEDRLEECLKWCGHEYQADMDHLSMFYSPEAARRFARRFLPDTPDLYLIGAGHHLSLTLRHWPESYDADFGIEKQIKQHLPLAEAGRPLGFEVVSFTYNDFGDSWICSGLVDEMHTLFGIRTGQYGLLQTREDAQRVYEWIAEDDQQGRRAEPEPYDYWLLVSYPLA